MLLFPVLAAYDTPSWHGCFLSLFQQTSGFPLSAKLILSGWQVIKMRSFNLVCTAFGVHFCRNGGETEGRWSGKGLLDRLLRAPGYSSSLNRWFAQRTKLMEDTSNTKLKLGCWFVCTKVCSLIIS